MGCAGRAGARVRGRPSGRCLPSPAAQPASPTPPGEALSADDPPGTQSFLLSTCTATSGHADAPPRLRAPATFSLRSRRLDPGARTLVPHPLQPLQSTAEPHSANKAKKRLLRVDAGPWAQEFFKPLLVQGPPHVPNFHWAGNAVHRFSSKALPRMGWRMPQDKGQNRSELPGI